MFHCPSCENPIDPGRGGYIEAQLAAEGSFACPHCGAGLVRPGGPAWLHRAAGGVFWSLLGVGAGLFGAERLPEPVAHPAGPWVLAAASGLVAWATRARRRLAREVRSEQPEEAEESSPELGHFVESRVQEILSDLAADQAGRDRVAMARDMGVTFAPGDPIVTWDGAAVLCGGAVAQAQVCPLTATLAVLLEAGPVEARLEVYARDGLKRATLAPPEGFSFVELRLGYVPPFAVKRVAAVVLCHSDEPVDEHSDWHFRIDAAEGRLERLSPAAHAPRVVG